MTPIFSKLTGFALLVASISALSASDAGHLEEGAQGWVGSQRSTWSLVKNARAGTAADGQNIVAATGAGANAFWVRQTSMEHYWAYQLGWFIDPAAGDDENNGATSGTALRTVAELTRRLSIVLQGTNYSFDLLGNIPSTDRMNWTPIFVGPAPGGATIFSQRGTLLFRGVQTVSRSGTLTNATQTTTSAQASAADGATVWTADIGKLLVMTGGAQIGETCWIAADLGAGTARVSSWVTSAGTAVGVVPALSTYNIVNLTTWACEGTFQAPNDSCIVTFQDIEVLPPANAAFYLIFGGAVLRPIRTKYTPAAGISLPGTSSSTLARACCFSSAANTAATPLSIQILSGGSVFTVTSGSLVLNAQVEALGNPYATFTDTLFQGSRVQVANSGTGSAQGGTVLFSGNCGFFDWDRNAAALGRDAAISVEGRGFVGIIGFVFGTTAQANTYGVRVEAGGQMMITSQTSAGPVAAITVAGATAAIRFDDPGVGAAVGTAIPPLVAGAVTPAVQPLTTWANFNAAPFNSYVMSYRNGARIYING